ncbi:MAG: PEP-CTERM sorting domain-containing protein [Candidatus Pacebacteria bacterium]|nr:PEP-CTERM sorting domain-containing protein [Candidatus Paceibacterota bacterium]
MKSWTKHIYWMVSVLVLAVSAVPTMGNLVGYWSFDDTANVGKDSSGYSNNLVSYGDATYATDATRGTVLSLDGNGDYLGQGASFPTGVPTGNESYTIALWYKYNGTTTAWVKYGLVSWGDTGTKLMNGFVYEGTNTIMNYWRGADLRAAMSGAVVDLDDGSWFHVAVTYDNATGSRNIYLNGLVVASDTQSGGLIRNSNFAIGKDVGATANFSGYMDDVVVYNSALSSTEVQDVMNGNIIPEPATIALLLSGSMFTVLTKRKK